MSNWYEQIPYGPLTREDYELLGASYYDESLSDVQVVAQKRGILAGDLSKLIFKELESKFIEASLNLEPEGLPKTIGIFATHHLSDLSRETDTETTERLAREIFSDADALVLFERDPELSEVMTEERSAYVLSLIAAFKRGRRQSTITPTEVGLIDEATEE